MKYQTTIMIDKLPRLPNGWHGHWAVVAKERKQWHKLVADAVGLSLPKQPLQKCTIVCTRHSASEPDYDNLVSSFKAAIDGLKICGVIADDRSTCVIDRLYRWEKASPKKGAIAITIEEVELRPADENPG